MIEPGPFELRVTGPTQRQLNRLDESVAAAIVEFMLGALAFEPYRLGGRLKRELGGFHAATRGSYRVTYEVDDADRAVIVHRIDHRATAYRPR